MTPIPETVPSRTESVSLEFDLRHPPEKVWRALTDPTLLGEWLLPVVGTELELEPGAAFTLTPTASGTRLSLVQSGFKPDQKQNLAGARYGWTSMGAKLADLLVKAA